jgi:hypothetical protein
MTVSDAKANYDARACIGHAAHLLEEALGQLSAETNEN